MEVHSVLLRRGRKSFERFGHFFVNMEFQWRTNGGTVGRGRGRATQDHQIRTQFLNF